MSKQTERITACGIRDSFLPRVEQLEKELTAEVKTLLYLLYKVDPKVDDHEEERADTLESMAGNFGIIAATLRLMT